jgi:hypothetical protein
MVRSAFNRFASKREVRSLSIPKRSSVENKGGRWMHKSKIQLHLAGGVHVYAKQM